MIYNVHGFQQARLKEAELDNDDAFILRAITGMYASSKMDYILLDNIRYIWVNQDYLQRQVGIIGTKRKVMRRVNDMINKGFLVSHTAYSKKGIKGTYYYIAPTHKLDLLRDLEPYDKMSKGMREGCDKMSFDGVTKCDTKDTINNIDNIYKKDKGESADNSLAVKDKDTIVNLWNEVANQYGLNQVRLLKAGTTRYNMLKARIDEYSLEEILEAINNIKSSPFLQGKNDRGWTIDFEWFVRPNNFPKVLEGNYIYEKKEEPRKTNGIKPLTGPGERIGPKFSTHIRGEVPTRNGC